MFQYFAIYLISAVLTLFPFAGNERVKTLRWVTVWLIFTLFVGLRHEVGADWQSYLNYFDNLDSSPVPSEDILLYLSTNDMGYVVLNWLSAYFGTGIYGVNLVCAAIFMTGLILFCRKQPLPYLALTIAIPIFVVTIAMGSVRQATALGWFFLALIAFQERRLGYFIFFMFLAGMFHKSVLIFLLLLLFLTNVRWFFGFFVMIALVSFFLYDIVAIFWKVYVEDTMYSEGGFIRVLMNAVPAVFLLLFWRRWKLFSDQKLWILFALLSLLSLVFVGSASTAVDRIAIYFAPWQIFAFSRLPLLAQDVVSRTAILVSILAVYGAVLFVWLNYAINANSWTPYRNILL